MMLHNKCGGGGGGEGGANISLSIQIFYQKIFTLIEEIFLKLIKNLS